MINSQICIYTYIYIYDYAYICIYKSIIHRDACGRKSIHGILYLSGECAILCSITRGQHRLALSSETKSKEMALNAQQELMWQDPAMILGCRTPFQIDITRPISSCGSEEQVAGSMKTTTCPVLGRLPNISHRNLYKLTGQVQLHYILIRNI